MGAVVIPFPRAARVSDRCRRGAAGRNAPGVFEACRAALPPRDALALVCAVAIAAGQGALLLLAFGVRVF